MLTQKDGGHRVSCKRAKNYMANPDSFSIFSQSSSQFLLKISSHLIWKKILCTHFVWVFFPHPSFFSKPQVLPQVAGGGVCLLTKLSPRPALPSMCSMCSFHMCSCLSLYSTFPATNHPSLQILTIPPSDHKRPFVACKHWQSWDIAS